MELNYDVAVIGGGAVGLAYAIRVKRENPELRVLVLEKAKEPRFKIGESTLSVTVESLLELGFTMPQLRRLFTIKSGLGFWYTDSAADELVSPVDVCNTEETFQVERRPMEIALTILAQSCGVEIRSGMVVSTGRSRLDGPDPMLVIRGSSGAADQVHCRVVCDASGPASVAARARGTHRKQEHITTNAYWSHFRKTASPGIPGWDAPMTHHICFPQGWFWFISLCSWENSPTSNLTAMIGALLNGLAFGMFCAKEAASATAGHLKDPARGDFASYDRLLHSVYRALSAENEALYRSWTSPAGFERVLMAKIGGGLPEVRNRADGLVHEDVPYRLLAPRHAKVFTDLVALTRDAASHREDRSPEIEAVTGRYLEELRTDPETIEARLGRFLTYYDDNLVRHENAAEVAQPGVFAAVACPDCRQYVNATLERCPACGQGMAA